MFFKLMKDHLVWNPLLVISCSHSGAVSAASIEILLVLHARQNPLLVISFCLSSACGQVSCTEHLKTKQDQMRFELLFLNAGLIHQEQGAVPAIKALNHTELFSIHFSYSLGSQSSISKRRAGQNASDQGAQFCFKLKTISSKCMCSRSPFR